MSHMWNDNLHRDINITDVCEVIQTNSEGYLEYYLNRLAVALLNSGNDVHRLNG